MVNFTGSTNVGRIIGVQAAQHLKPAMLELGGKNPLIILEDADPDLAVDAAVFGAFMNSGQICMSNRPDHRPQEPGWEFHPEVRVAGQALPSRRSRRSRDDRRAPDQHAWRAACLRARQRRRHQGRQPAHWRRSDRGANGNAHQAGRPDRRDYRHGHLRLRDLRPTGRSYHPVDSTEAAIDTEYGLTGGVITRDLNAALDVVSRVRSGIIHINDQGIADEPMAPFGGVKNSGYGKPLSVARATLRLIDRGDLLAALDRAAAKKVTIISAPAGSGKTSLLRAWASGRVSRADLLSSGCSAISKMPSSSGWPCSVRSVMLPGKPAGNRRPRHPTSTGGRWSTGCSRNSPMLATASRWRLMICTS